MTQTEAEERIAHIDGMFAAALGWGSWMVMAANEREDLAERFGLPHKHLARTSDGASTD